MAIALAVACAVLLGVSDFLAARAARTNPSITVTRTVVLTSLIIAPVGLLVIESRWTWRDSLLGGVAGLAMIGGLMLLYRGYAVARMGIVAPMSSVLIAAIPFAVDAVRGERPGGWGIIGAICGVIAIVATSVQPAGDGSVRLGVVLGLTSGVLFAGAFTLMGEVDTSAGVAPVVVQRASGLLLLLAVATIGSDPLLVTERSGRRLACSAGVVALVAIICLQLAFQRGASGPVAVASSQFASVAVVLAVAINGERMRWWQGLGVVLSAVGVGLLNLG